MLGQACHRAEGLAALVALDLHPARGMHPLVSAQVGELGVALEADLTPERFDRAVDVSVLFKARACGKCFATFRAGVASSPDMMCSDVSLQVAGIGENLVAVFAGESSVLSMNHFVSKQVGSPCKTFGAVLTLVLTSVVAVDLYHVIIQPEKENEFRLRKSYQKSYLISLEIDRLLCFQMQFLL